VLKSIAVLPNNSFCPFSPTLSLCPYLPLPFSLNLSPDYPSLLHTRHLLRNLLTTLQTPNLLHSLTQAPYTTTTEICPDTHKGHKNQQPLHHFPHSPTPLLSPLLVPLYPIPKTFIASPTNVKLLKSHYL
jgi:hypothetical protein